ncbi:unnamed protein product [Amaranthus hypochondriacus]
MPEQDFLSRSLTCSESPCLKMEALALHTDYAGTDIYLKLGLKEQEKGAMRTPRAPPVSIQQYVDRIFKYAGCSPSCFIVAYIYVDRYLQQTKTFLTSLNVHRLLATSVMVAAKFVDDSFFNNAYYAKVGGISTSEMNKLEMKLLFSVDFRLQINVETFRKYCLLLEKESKGCQIDRPIKTCWVKGSWSRNDECATKTPVAR